MNGLLVNQRAKPNGGMIHGQFGIIVPRYCPEIENVLTVAKTRRTLLPEKYIITQLNIAINELKFIGTFQKRELMYFFGFNSLFNRYDNSGIFSLQDSLLPFSSINFANPNLYYCTRVNGTGNFPYTRKKGLFCSTASYLDTGWSQSVGVKYTQNDASLTYYGKSVFGQGSVGWSDTVTNVKTIFFGNGTTAISIAINTAETANTGQSGLWPGTNQHYHAQRVGTNMAGYFSGVVARSITGASVSQKSPETVKLLGHATTGGVMGTINTSGEMFFVAVGSALPSVASIKYESDILTALRTKLGL